MKVRYQADADLDRRIVRATRRHEPAIDFQLASEVQSGRGLQGLSDEQVLALAAQEGRILVTHDYRTMPGHFARFIATATSPGVIILSQRMPLSVAAEWMVLIWAASEAEEWVNQLISLSR